MKLQDHDGAMGMASLALTAKNIALDAMVTETDTLRDKVDALSPKAGPARKPRGRGGEQRGRVVGRAVDVVDVDDGRRRRRAHIRGIERGA